ncbi:MAG: hypothetical protein Q9214_004785, partial [Letrouitia sp. 1 TL-2023]
MESSKPSSPLAREPRPQNDENLGADSQVEVGDQASSFKKSEPYHPLFFLTEPSEQYLGELNDNLNPVAPCLTICSKDPHKAFEHSADVLSRENQPSPEAFIGSTIEEIYDFFTKHLRPEIDSTAPEQLTYFTFLAVDAGCIQASPSECIICCDAPDYNEEQDDVVLKTLRLPIKEVVQYLCPLEQLRLTMSDVADLPERAWSTIPAPTVIQDPDDPPREYRVATHGQARSNRRKLLKLAADAQYDHNYSASEDLSYFKARWNEFFVVSEMDRTLSQMARRGSGRIQYKPNPSKEFEDEFQEKRTNGEWK